MLILEEKFTQIELNIGNIYKIKMQDDNYREAKLISQTERFFVFKYKSKSGDFIRTTISKFDYYKNNSIIKEV